MLKYLTSQTSSDYLLLYLSTILNIENCDVIYNRIKPIKWGSVTMSTSEDTREHCRICDLNKD